MRVEGEAPEGACIESAAQSCAASGVCIALCSVAVQAVRSVFSAGWLAGWRAGGLVGWLAGLARLASPSRSSLVSAPLSLSPHHRRFTIYDSQS